MIEDSFFLTKEYLEVNSGLDVSTFFGKSSVIHYVIKDNVVYCPYQSSFSLFSGSTTAQEIGSFLEHLKGFKKVVFTLPPLFIPEAKRQLNLLLKCAFCISRIEVGQYLSFEEGFENSLSSRYKSLNKKMDGLGAHTRVLPLDYLPLCYQLLKKSRDRKGYEMTISEEKLNHLMHSFPSNFLLYGTFLENKLVACSATIKVSKQVMYQFAWGHDEEYDKLSPLIFHNLEVKKELNSSHVLFIDFGLSSLDGEINRGVFRFKKHQGALPYKKYFLEYKF